MMSSTKKEAILVFLLLMIAFAYFYHDPGWNGNSRLGLTFALVEEGRLTIDSYHDRAGMSTKDKAIYNGHYYSSKAIGSSLVAVIYYFPLYKLARFLNITLEIPEIKYILTLFSIGLPSALSGSLMYVLLRQVTGDRFRAYIFTIVIYLGTMIFPFSVIFFSHQLAGSLLFTSFFLIFQYRINLNYRKKVVLFLIGLILGLALITEYPIALIVILLTVYYFFIVFKTGSLNRGLAVILPALGACIPLFILLTYNMLVFGSPISTAYTHSADPLFHQQEIQGFVGIGWPDLSAMYFMTVHPAFGLFFQSPVLIMSLMGIWYMFRVPNFRFEAAIALIAFLSLLILYSGFYAWWGGWNFGPRYLVPMLVFLGFPLVFVPKRWFLSIIILGFISLFQMFIVVSSLILTPDIYYKQFDHLGFFEYSSIYSYCVQLLINGQFSENIGNKIIGLNNWISLALLLTIILSISFLFFAKRDKSQVTSFRPVS